MKNIAMFAMAAAVLPLSSHAATTWKPASTFAHSPEAGKGAVASLKGVQKEVSAVTQTLLNSAFSIGASSLSQVSGYNYIDTPQKLTCPGPDKCVIEAEEHVQIGNNTTAGNRIAILSTVNGFYFEPTVGGAYLGDVPSDGSYNAYTFNQIRSVQPGKYTLQTELYSDDPLDYANYEITYRIYDTGSQ